MNSCIRKQKSNETIIHPIMKVKNEYRHRITKLRSSYLYGNLGTLVTVCAKSEMRR